MQSLFQRHIYKELIISCVLITLTLAGVIILAQSVKFLEIVIEAGASSGTFFLMILYALPRFFEVALPIAVLAATVFIYNKTILDSEMVIMQGAGCSPRYLSRPAFFLGLTITIFMIVNSFYLAPASLAKLQALKHVVRAQYSTLIFREGVFTSLENGLTLYIKEKTGENTLQGIMVYDGRTETGENPALITAEKGIAYADEDSSQIVIYNGQRRQRDPETGQMSSLSFEQYNISIPSGKGPVTDRWKEPNERTFLELIQTDYSTKNDRKYKSEIVAEIHKRITLPFLSIGFALIPCLFLLTATTSRRGYTQDIIKGCLLTVLLYGLYIGCTSIAKNSLLGVGALYAIAFLPPTICVYFLAQKSVQKKARPA